MLKSLLIQPKFKEISLTGDRPGSISDISFTLCETGGVSWTGTDGEEPGKLLKGVGWSRDGDLSHRTVRYLLVHGLGRVRTRGEAHELGGGAGVSSYIHPYFDESTKDRDRLLLPRSRSDGGVNLRLPRLWMTACVTKHKQTCSPREWVGLGSAQLRMIDAEA